MIPDMRTNCEGDAEAGVQEQVEAEYAKWQAELRLFKGSLSLDQKLIQRTELGSQALHDILEWNDNEHVRTQGLTAKHLVKRFMDANMPKATATSWSDVPGSIALLVQRIHDREGDPKNLPRFLLIVDFDTEFTRRPKDH